MAGTSLVSSVSRAGRKVRAMDRGLNLPPPGHDLGNLAWSPRNEENNDVNHLRAFVHFPTVHF
jgi:hypothetical protein